MVHQSQQPINYLTKITTFNFMKRLTVLAIIISLFNLSYITITN
jgi:hypothetical protein